jgi:hypothetical protein
MKRHIVIEIDCEDAGKACGPCEYSAGGAYYCPMSTDEERVGWWSRGPSCLAAERKLTRLVEAGEEMRDSHINHDRRAREEWDAALAKIKNGGEK